MIALLLSFILVCELPSGKVSTVKEAHRNKCTEVCESVCIFGWEGSISNGVAISCEQPADRCVCTIECNWVDKNPEELVSE